MIVHAGPFRSDVVWCSPIHVQLDLSRGWGKAKETLPWQTGAGKPSKSWQCVALPHHAWRWDDRLRHGRQSEACCLSLFLTVLVETLTFVGQWLRRVLDVAYLCWRASRTSALSSRPVVARLLPECGGSFTSPGFSLCLLSILYTVLCYICIVWAMCDTVAPAAFTPMTCHCWLRVLFPNWPVTKSWLLRRPKLCWFQLYCSKTIWSISLIFARHVTRYIHIILTIFQEATQCLTLWKISLKNICKNFFPGVYIWSLLTISRDLTAIFSAPFTPPIRSLAPSYFHNETYIRSWYNPHALFPLSIRP